MCWICDYCSTANENERYDCFVCGKTRVDAVESADCDVVSRGEIIKPVVKLFEGIDTILKILFFLCVLAAGSFMMLITLEFFSLDNASSIIDNFIGMGETIFKKLGSLFYNVQKILSIAFNDK